MKAIRILGNEKSEMVEINKPSPNEGEVVVKIESLALCGSCIKLRYKPSKEECLELTKNIGIVCDPMSIPGHEMTGTIVETGKNTNMKIGDRVFIFPFIADTSSPFFKEKKYKYATPLKILGYTIDGGNTEFLSVPELNCYKLPDYVTFDQGAMLLDPVGAPYGAIKNLGINKEDTVLILGTGPIGLGATMITKLLGPKKIIVVDKVKTRAELAGNLGADHVINDDQKNIAEAIQDLTENIGADLVLDCIGNKDSFNYSMMYAKPEGRVGVIGEPGFINNVSISDQLIHKDLLIAGSWVYDPEKMDDLYSLIKSGLEIEKIITHRFALEDSKKAWELFNTYETGKVIISP